VPTTVPTSTVTTRNTTAPTSNLTN
jgi:hypothetical protein